MRNQNGKKELNQVCHNMMDIANMMNCTAKFITSSNQEITTFHFNSIKVH